MSASRLDKFYRRVLLPNSKFFTKGWGSPEHILTLLEFKKFMCKANWYTDMIDKDYPIIITKQQVLSDYCTTTGKFLSPLVNLLPNIVHPAVQTAHFQVVIPKTWKSDVYRPVCIHLAGTGDHYFWRRRQIMAKPLARDGIASIILENPFYGFRKPKDQHRSSLLYVSDIFVMGGCLMLECGVLLDWCEKQGFGPLGVTGLSMGGHMASLVAATWPKPLVLVPCLSWSTASSAFTEGVMSEAIDWGLLQYQYNTNKQYQEIITKLNDYPIVPTLIGDHNFISQDVLEAINSKRPHCTLINKSLKRIIGNKRRNMKVRDKDALQFMRELMDECTHLKNFNRPVDPSLIIALCAQSDAYIPRKGCMKLEDLWPGATVRYLNGGHVSAYLKNMNVFRQCIREGFERAKKVCPPPENPFQGTYKIMQ